MKHAVDNRRIVTTILNSLPTHHHNIHFMNEFIKLTYFTYKHHLSLSLPEGCSLKKRKCVDAIRSGWMPEPHKVTNVHKTYLTDYFIQRSEWTVHLCPCPTSPLLSLPPSLSLLSQDLYQI